MIFDRELARAVKRRVIRRRRSVSRFYDRHISPRDKFENVPSIMVNSLPKSGTHLLLQYARQLPNTRNYETFITERPSHSGKIYGQEKITQQLLNVLPGEVFAAHLPYNIQTEEILKNKNTMNLFIYRDPRAVIISEIFYLTNLAPWNFLSKRFKTQKTLISQIELAIYGDGTPELPRLKTRFGKYLQWIELDHVIPIKFEDLISLEKRETILNKIINRQQMMSRGVCTANINKIANAFMPDESHTYSGKDPRRWQNLIPKKIQTEILYELEEYSRYFSE